MTRVGEVRPDLPVVVVGIQSLDRSSSTPEREADLLAKIATLRGTLDRHDNVVGFIDPYTENWLTGTGSLSSPAGDGNQDVYIDHDSVHLSPAGVAYYDGRIVGQMRVLRATLPAP